MAPDDHSQRPRHRAHDGQRLRRLRTPGDDADTTSSGVHGVEVAYRVWIQRDGELLFGPGGYQLLSQIERSGSIGEAARQMGMAYSKAWLLLRDAERRLGMTLLDRHPGGVAGGGSCLTTHARLLLQRYDAFRAELDLLVAELFARHFGDLEDDPGEGGATPAGDGVQSALPPTAVRPR